MRTGALFCTATLLGATLAGAANAGPERPPLEPMLTRLVHQYALAAAYAERCDGASRDRTMRDVVSLLDTHFPSRRVGRAVPHLHAIVDHIPVGECSGDAVAEQLSEAFRLYEDAVQAIRDSRGY